MYEFLYLFYHQQSTDSQIPIEGYSKGLLWQKNFINFWVLHSRIEFGQVICMSNIGSNLADIKWNYLVLWWFSQARDEIKQSWFKTSNTLQTNIHTHNFMHVKLRIKNWVFLWLKFQFLRYVKIKWKFQINFYVFIDTHAHTPEKDSSVLR